MKQDPNKRGALTVEAAVILPFYILTIVFILNFMNIFYTQLAVQMGMNNAANVVAQYSYLADLTVGVDNLTLSKDTDDKITKVTDGVNDVKNKLGSLSKFFSGGIKINELGTMVEEGKALSKSMKDLGSSVSTIDGKNLVNALVATGVKAGGSAGLTYIVNDYLDEMKINRSLIAGDIVVVADLGEGPDYDLFLTAYYEYKDPMFSVFFDTIPMKQSVVVHPWIGGSTKGIRQVKR